MKKALTLVIFLLTAAASRAAVPEFTWGIEWGSSLSFLSKDYVTFVAADGFLADMDDVNGYTHINGLIMARTGIALGRYELTLGAGWQGGAKEARFFPFTLKANGFIDGRREKGIFLTAEAGVGIPEKKSGKICASGNLGLGYRLPIYNGLSIDYGIGLQTAYVHRYDIVDPYSGEYLKKENIRSSNSIVNAVRLSVALNF